MVKLFSHTDLDGIGCGILAQLAFGKDNVEISYCDYDNIDSTVKEYLETEQDDTIPIYITDIRVNEETAELLNKRGNVKLLDHHPTALGLNKYDWCDVVIEDSKGIKTSGTMLFYHWLGMNGCLSEELETIKVLELFAGTRSIGKAFEARGHEVYSVEWNKDFENIDLYADISQVTAQDILEKFGHPDFIWASPDCTTFSIAAISHHRRKNPETGNLDPISDYAKFCDATDQHVVSLIKELNPTYYFIENPRGGMRKMSWMQDLPRYTVTYCKYGDTRMKSTDIWTNHPNPKFLPMCKNGDPCHVSSPRGSRTGTQGLKGAKERSVIPQKLCEHIVDIYEEGLAENNLHDKCKSCDNKWSSLECDMCENFDMYKNQKENNEV